MMTTNFPSGLDSFTNPTATDAMDSVTVPHADQHANVNDAVEALQAKVGVDGSAVTSSLDYQLAYVRISNATFTNVGSFDVTGFSGDFDIYRLVVTVKRHTSGTSSLTCQIRLNGSSYGSNYYGASWYANYLGNSGVSNRNNGTNIPLPDCAAAPPALIDMTIRGPNDQAFGMTYNGYNTASSSMVVGGFSNYASPNNFDEIRIFGSTNITGSWQLSGARV